MDMCDNAFKAVAAAVNAVSFPSASCATDTVGTFTAIAGVAVDTVYAANSSSETEPSVLVTTISGASEFLLSCSLLALCLKKPGKDKKHWAYMSHLTRLHLQIVLPDT